MKIAIASDHAGFQYKQRITAFLRERGHEVEDFGTNSDASVDYPDFIVPAARAVATGRCERGIVLGGSGNGEAMAANKIKGIRCALCWNEDSARFARAHNDANMLSMGQRLIDEDMALRIVTIWLDTPFEGGRHIPRVTKLNALGGS
ncbi:MAG TPA: ribose 5-phosphate isomerase B [Candidatus Krumholzibacteria bacterium]|nr:ribose 5-phosphate isomerase B [Candidatus Krumholzibacteria bacterium]